MVGGCAAAHRATKAVMEATSNSELKNMLQMGIKGTEQSLETFRAFLSANGVQEDRNRQNALVDIARECEEVAKTEGSDGGPGEQRAVSHYLRTIHYALAGYEYYVPALKAAGENEFSERFAKDKDVVEKGLKEFEAYMQA